MSVRVPMDPKKFGDVFGAMVGLNKVIESAGLDKKLLYLVEVRVSQINGCGFCLDMHTKDARLTGELRQCAIRGGGDVFVLVTCQPADAGNIALDHVLLHFSAPVV